MSKKSLQSFFTAFDAALQSVEGVKTQDQQAGIVRSAKDGVVHIYGLLNLRIGEVVRIQEANVEALVMQLEGRNAYAVQLQASLEVTEGQSVMTTGRFLGIDVSSDFLGRVVDSLGTPVDDAGAIKGETFMPLERIAPGVMTREPVSEPVQTGILAIDAMIPIGRGQRELIIGDRQTGKTAVAIDAILNQKDQDMVCVYVACGQRESSTATVVRKLQEHGAMKYTVVVTAGASSPAVIQYLAPYAGAAIAEYFMSRGKDVLVVYDDLSKHAVAYRELSLLLRRPPGREAYPGDVFYLHSRLLERSARLNKENGGGSMTALPIIETQANDVSAYIPTNVISITDGQIFLQSDLFYSGIRPAINIGISVSRVGGNAQTSIMKKVAGSAKLDLAQYYELAAFSQFSSELDEATKKQLTRGQRVVEAMKQPENRPYTLWQEVVILRAVTQGHLDETPVKEVRAQLKHLLLTVETQHQDLISAIDATKKLTDEVQELLDGTITKVLER